MKPTKKLFVFITAAILCFNLSFAQENQRPEFVTVTTNHWNMDKEDGSYDEWKTLQKEFFDKVTSKNEYILGTGVYTHRFTADNTEIIFVQSFKDWEAMGKFGERNEELIMEAWPDEDERNAFFDKLDDYFTMEHSDEIYATMPNAKPLGDTDKELVWLLRKSHFAYPKEGSQKDFMDTFTEYTQNVFHKNEVIKAYYPMAHAWGSDKTEFVEAFAVESLGDLDEMFKRNNEYLKLIKLITTKINIVHALYG